jgi:mRNA interferase MazF
LAVKRAGQIALTQFASTDLSVTKLRPVLLLRQASIRFDDWLVCMVSSRLHQAVPDLDERILLNDGDFPGTGLKVSGVIRASRLAVIDGALLAGAIGTITDARLTLIRRRLARWILGKTTAHRAGYT